MVPKYQFDQIFHSLMIRMELATAADITRVIDLITKDFMPGNPLKRSLGFAKESRTAWEIGRLHLILRPMLMNGTSVLAIDEDNEIVGKYSFDLS